MNFIEAFGLAARCGRVTARAPVKMLVQRIATDTTTRNTNRETILKLKP
jgi:hypothetical protein